MARPGFGRPPRPEDSRHGQDPDPAEDRGQPGTNTEDYLRMYPQMVRILTFEDHAKRLYLDAKISRADRICTAAKEAVAVGICEALDG